MYTACLAGVSREREREKNIQLWKKRGVDLTKYTHDFSDAKGVEWLKEIQAKGALDQPPPSLIKTSKEEREEEKENEKHEGGEEENED